MRTLSNSAVFYTMVSVKKQQHYTALLRFTEWDFLKWKLYFNGRPESEFHLKFPRSEISTFPEL